jgi:2-alkyl-3-oxoalkanoate reductase
MKILLTGGRGLLGTATAQELIAQGHDVTCFQRGTPSIDVRTIRGDVRDQRAVTDAVRGSDAVVHMAALVSTVGPWQDFWDVNVRGTSQILDVAQRCGVERFVYVSSPSVAHTGGALVGRGATPASPQGARSAYSRSKALAEQLVLKSTGLATVAIRPHLVWGPGDTQLIGRIVDRARAGRLVLIDGGRALIDTTVVDNAATAIHAAVERATEPLVRGQAFVISNGEPRTVYELLTAICAAAGVDGPTRSVPAPVARAAGSAIEVAWRRLRRTDEPPMTRFLAEQLSTAHWFAQQQAREALAWMPTVDIATGLRRLRSWFHDGVANSPHG